MDRTTPPQNRNTLLYLCLVEKFHPTISLRTDWRLLSAKFGQFHFGFLPYKPANFLSYAWFEGISISEMDMCEIKSSRSYTIGKTPARLSFLGKHPNLINKVEAK